MNAPSVNRSEIRRLLVLGGGYTGRRFAAALAERGVPAALTRRSLPETGDGDGPGLFRWLRFDGDVGVLPSPEELAGTTHVLVTIPPDGNGQDPVLRHLGERIRTLQPAWVAYLSTTGVYGDTGGAWVDETSPTAAAAGRSSARLACEQAWRARGLPLQVIRLPAIYGPGRTPFASLLDGSARLIHKPGQVFSRVHVDDIVGALLHCLHLPAPERPDTLIVADEDPCPSSETLGYAAHLLGCKLPEVQTFERIATSLSPMARSFWSENRRASSLLLRQTLGYRLHFPSYRTGFPASRPLN